MLSVGALIWISIRPLLRLWALMSFRLWGKTSQWVIRVLCTSSGYIITKADIFPAVAARGTGKFYWYTYFRIACYVNNYFVCLRRISLCHVLCSQKSFPNSPRIMSALLVSILSYPSMNKCLTWVLRSSHSCCIYLRDTWSCNSLDNKAVLLGPSSFSLWNASSRGME